MKRFFGLLLSVFVLVLFTFPPTATASTSKQRIIYITISTENPYANLAIVNGNDVARSVSGYIQSALYYQETFFPNVNSFNDVADYSLVTWSSLYYIPAVLTRANRALSSINGQPISPGEWKHLQQIPGELQQLNINETREVSKMEPILAEEASGTWWYSNMKSANEMFQEDRSQSKFLIAQIHSNLQQLQDTTIVAKNLATGKVTRLTLGSTRAVASTPSLLKRLFGNDPIPLWLTIALSSLGTVGGLLTLFLKRKWKKQHWGEFVKALGEMYHHTNLEGIEKNGKMLNKYFSTGDLLNRIKNGNTSGSRSRLMRYLKQMKNWGRFEKGAKIGGYAADIAVATPDAVNAWTELHSNDSVQTKSKVVLNDVGNAMGTIGGSVVGGMVGARIGAWVGGAIGTLIEPGGGTVVGAAVGDLIGSMIGSTIGGHYGGIIGGHLGDATSWAQHQSASLWQGIKRIF